MIKEKYKMVVSIERVAGYSPCYNCPCYSEIKLAYNGLCAICKLQSGSHNTTQDNDGITWSVFSSCPMERVER